MKNTIKSITTITVVSLFSFCILCDFAKAQSTAVDQKTYQEKNEVLNCINRFFDAFRKGDTVLMKKEMDKNLRLETIFTKNGTTTIQRETASEFIKIIGQPRKNLWDERITSAKVEIDGELANAWCEYEFYVDTNFSHCGIDNIQLYKENTTWKIFALQDTRHRGNECQKHFPKNTYDEESLTVFLSPEAEAKAEIELLMNNWHNAAAVADETTFFGSMGNACVYLGTDKKEYWTKQEFESWSKKYFEKDKAWDFKPYNRNIYFTNDHQYAWFDELLNTWMGVCRGSGVVQLINGRWYLVHYNLALTCPNEQMKKFVKINK